MYPEVAVHRCSVKMFFRRSLEILQDRILCYNKYTDLRSIVLLEVLVEGSAADILLWFYTRTPVETWSCTLSNKIANLYNFFSIKVSFHQRYYNIFAFTDTDDSHNSSGGERTVFILLRTFRQIFVTLHMTIPRIFNHIASNYQTAVWWALPPVGISIWFIVNGMLISVYWRI